MMHPTGAARRPVTAAGLSQRAGPSLDSHPCQAPGRWCRRRGGAQTPQAQDRLDARRLWFAVARGGVSCEFPTRPAADPPCTRKGGYPRRIMARKCSFFLLGGKPDGITPGAKSAVARLEGSDLPPILYLWASLPRTGTEDSHKLAAPNPD